MDQIQIDLHILNKRPLERMMCVRATISASEKFAVRHIPGTVSSVKYGGPSVRVAPGPHALARRLALCQVGGGRQDRHYSGAECFSRRSVTLTSTSSPEW